MNEIRKDFSKSESDSFSKKESLKHKKYLLFLDRDIIGAKLKALPAVPAQGVDANAAERKILNDSLAVCNSEIAALETSLMSIEKVVSAQKNTFIFPTFGEIDEVENQKLRLQIPIFDPLLNIPTIDDFWKKLLDYGESLEWSEVAYKKAISNLLQNEAYNLYYIKRDKPLKDILDALQGSFHNYETIFDLSRQLDTCKRQPGQSLTNFMNAVHLLLYRTSTLRGDCEIASKAVETEILRKKLLENASGRAQNAVFKAQKKAMRNGEILSYETLLSIAKESENEEGTH